MKKGQILLAYSKEKPTSSTTKKTTKDTTLNFSLFKKPIRLWPTKMNRISYPTEVQVRQKRKEKRHQRIVLLHLFTMQKVLRNEWLLPSDLSFQSKLEHKKSEFCKLRRDQTRLRSIMSRRLTLEYTNNKKLAAC